MRDWFRRIPKFSLVGGLASGLVMLAFAYTLLRADALSRHNCQQVELVKTRIRLVIRQGLRTLGKPGSAGYGYYVRHPGELEQVRKMSAQELREFAPTRC